MVSEMRPSKYLFARLVNCQPSIQSRTIHSNEGGKFFGKNILASIGTFINCNKVAISSLFVSNRLMRLNLANPSFNRDSSNLQVSGEKPLGYTTSLPYRVRPCSSTILSSFIELSAFCRTARTFVYVS